MANDFCWRSGRSCTGPAEQGGPLNPKHVRMYSRAGCEDSSAARSFLLEQGVPCEEVDLNKNPKALAFVMSVNEGKQRTPTFDVDGHTFRSEERRVGKECRSRWSPSP